MFLTFFTPNFMSSFGKIVGAVSEISCDARTAHARTDRPHFIGPFSFQLGTKKVRTTVSRRTMHF